MINIFEGLVNDVIKTEKNPKDYLTDFFVKSNFKNYNTDSGLDKNELRAVKMMFESKKDIKKRAESVWNMIHYVLKLSLLISKKVRDLT